MIRKKALFSVLCLAGLLVILTFAIPALQWLAGKLALLSRFGGLVSSVVIILCVCLWYWRTKPFSFFPSPVLWKVVCYLGGLIVLGLLIINIRNAPVAKITGEPRSPLEVMDVILFAPLAEELIFRGAIWSILARFAKNSRWSVVVVLVGSSLLFGVEHLGYWAQSVWPLPVDALIHAGSMVLAGICFGLFRQTSRSLAVPVVVHMLANGAILLIQ